MRRALYAILVAIPGAVFASGPYDGLYRPQGAPDWDCRSIGQPSGAIAIANGSLIAVESRCSLRDPKPVRGMTATLFDMVCDGKVGHWEERVMILDTPDGIAMIRGKGPIALLSSCR
ncbi:hypothetical protein ABMC89_12035 [Sulfitobacter sp. HNIBRBA3233]|uniref:hypothetical protein n=1 Tax=Sulfitobacter marinivivus TaxID=3158558 RepID=UPI0032E02DAF